MGGLTLYGSLMIGVILIIGQRLFPDSVVMWFASPEGSMLAWRELIVASLIVLAMVRQYYHNFLLQLLWAGPAFGLWWAGGVYFLNNPSYVFDAMLMLSAGAAFAITALLPNGDPINFRPIISLLIPKRFAAPREKQYYAGQLASWQYMADVKNASHRLSVPWHFKHTLHE
jgi:hypothetical protein